LRRTIGIWAIATLIPACGELEADATSTSDEVLILGSKTVNPAACNGAATQCNFGLAMHCCPAGSAMTGAHFAANTFECRAIGPATSCSLVSMANFRSFEGYLIPACPEGTYMRGFHQAANKATCCNYPNGNIATMSLLDGSGEPPTQDAWPSLHRFFTGACYGGTMHACPGNSVMVGLNVPNNNFACEF
jgi:hypothetical protein